MGCGCKGSATVGSGAGLRTGLFSYQWDLAVQAQNRSALHPLGHDPRAYDLAGQADAATIAELAPPGEFPTVVDFGAGDGRVARHLAPRYVAVIAVEGSPSALRQIRQSLPAVRRVLGDGHDLVKIVGMVDAIVAWGVIDHLPVRHGVSVIAGLATALRPGGRLIATVPIGPAQVEPTDWNGVATWTLDGLDGACAAAGLTPSATRVAGTRTLHVYERQ